MSVSTLSRTVTTQAELDAALADEVRDISINSPAGVWIEVRAYGSATVSAYGSATVRASGSATVSAYGSATVRAYGSATVRAYGSATVRAYGSATVSAYGSATVRAYDSATVRAYGSATVRAYDSATVRAYDSATVSAYGSATVRAYGSATVRAYDSATVRASKFVAIHLHSQHVTLDGDGHVIDVTALDLNDPDTWCDYHGIDVENGIAYVYKAVGDDYRSAYAHRGTFTSYAPGSTPEAPDWDAGRFCGGGLHFSPTPVHALAYRDDAKRFLRCGVRLDELTCLGDKVKAKRVVVGCVEVDEHARLIDAGVVA